MKNNIRTIEGRSNPDGTMRYYVYYKSGYMRNYEGNNLPGSLLKWMYDSETKRATSLYNTDIVRVERNQILSITPYKMLVLSFDRRQTND